MGDTPSWDDLNPAAPNDTKSPEIHAPEPQAIVPQAEVPESAPEWGSLSKAEPAEAHVAPEWDDLGSKEDHYGTFGQQALTAIEGAGQGILGPLAPMILKATGAKPEDMAARAEQNPWVHGISEGVGFGASMLAGTGEAALLTKAGEAALQAAKIGEATSIAGKVGSAAIKGAVEGGLFQLGEEGSKYVLGTEDPETPVANSLANIGYAGLLGGGLTAGMGITGMGASKGLKAISNTRAAKGLSQFLEDFGSRWKYHTENPDVAESVVNELRDFHGSTAEAMDDIYGQSGKKAQAISQLTKDVSPDQLSNHLNEIGKIIKSAPSKVTENPEIRELFSEWENKVTPTKDPVTYQPINSPDAADVFQATDYLKRRLQAIAKFNSQNVTLSEQGLRNGAGNLSGAISDTLENTSVWDKAGEFQKELNKAVSEFIPANKDFLSKFTEKELGENTVSPGKVNTYVNQLGKSAAEIKQSMMKNYLKAADSFRSRVNDLHARLGIESPLKETPMQAVKGTIGMETPGGSFADKVNSFGINRMASSISQTIAGADMGFNAGGVPGALAGAAAGHVAPYLESAIGKKIREHAVPSILRILSSGKPGALAEALEHADNVSRGQSATVLGINSLFSGAKIAGQQAASFEAKEKDREKIKKFVEGGGTTRQMQNELQKEMQQKKRMPSQNFADGGAVSPQPMQIQESQEAPDHFSEVFPTQNIMMNAAKGRVYSYLNTLRPQPNASKLPFDDEPDNKEPTRIYEKAVDIAASPLSIIHSIKNGSLTPEELGHFKSMWPEIHSQLSQGMTKKVIEAQQKKEKPPYRIRQAMSLFLGAPLDSTMTQQMIQAAQSVYVKKQPPGQAGKPQGKPKKGTSTLSDVSKQYQTGVQAAASRSRS